MTLRPDARRVSITWRARAMNLRSSVYGGFARAWPRKLTGTRTVEKPAERRIRASSSRKAGPHSPSLGGSSVLARLMHLPRRGLGPTRAVAAGAGVKTGEADEAAAHADAAIVRTARPIAIRRAAIATPCLCTSAGYSARP